MKRKSVKKSQLQRSDQTIERDLIVQCIRFGTIEWEGIPQSIEELPPVMSAKLRRLQRICQSLDIDVFAGCIVVDLLERMDAMQRDMENMRSATERSRKR